MTKISELEERIARMEKALIYHNIMPDPNAKIETQFPHVEADKHFAVQKRMEEEFDLPETQYPYKV